MRSVAGFAESFEDVAKQLPKFAAVEIGTESCDRGDDARQLSRFDLVKVISRRARWLCLQPMVRLLARGTLQAPFEKRLEAGAYDGGPSNSCDSSGPRSQQFYDANHLLSVLIASDSRRARARLVWGHTTTPDTPDERVSPETDRPDRHAPRSAVSSNCNEQTTSTAS